MKTEVDIAGDREPIDRIADEFLERYRAGERPPISEYTAAHPQLAAEIRELFPALVVLERLGPRPDELAVQSGLHDAAAPQQLGDYRILREVGRGGMGVVYEAVQESLGRHVALKVLPAHALLDAMRLKRFQHEAQAAAKLHHTNIVPVFGVGTAEGVHFYAMQYIPGRGLNEVIDEVRRLKAAGASGASPTDRQPPPAQGDDTPVAANLSTISDTPRFYRSVARLGAQVADALAHAHLQGVLHRDVKPANLLLDAGGTVWVTDFGLAKAEGMEELTQPGDMVGTLRYTAPEQLRGEGDARCDIYSLGVTLYELLTLRPAFDAADRVSLVRQIAQDEPPRPRKLDRRIPRDLETIVLKTIAKEPARRYATADEMAEDLRGFLGDRPIKARRTPWWEHMGRWCRRNPAVATACSVAVAALIGGFAVSLWQWDRANRNYRAAQLSADQATASALQEQAHAQQAERDFRLAFQAVDQMLSRAGYDGLESVPHMERGRKELLQDAVRFYQALLQGREHRPELQVELARARRRLGDIHGWLGDYESAQREYKLALAMSQKLLSEQPKNLDYRRMVAGALTSLATFRAYQQPDHPSAEADLMAALGQWESLDNANPGNEESARFQAYLAWRLAALYREASRLEEAEALLRKSLALLEGAAAAQRVPPDFRRVQADLLVSLGNVVEARGDKAPAEAHFRRAVELLEGVIRADPVPNHRIRLANACSNLGENLAQRNGPADEVERHFTRSLQISQKLVEDFPEALSYYGEVAAASDRYGRWLRERGRLDDAKAAHQRAIELWKRSADADGADLESRHRLSAAEHNRALVALNQRDLTTAKSLLLSAIKGQTSVARQRPNDRRTLVQLTQHYESLAETLRREGDVPEAERALKRQVDFFVELAAEPPNATSEVRLALLRAYNHWGGFLLQAERPQDAAAVFQQSVDAARQFCDDCPQNPYARSELGGMLSNLAMALARHQRHAEAVTVAHEAITQQQQALSARPQQESFRRYCRNHHWVLADALIALGDYRRGAEAYQESQRLFPDLFQEYRGAVASARCAALAAEDSRLSEAERKEAVERYVAVAIELLQAARGKDAKELVGLKSQSEFRVLEGRPEFQQLLTSLDDAAN